MATKKIPEKIEVYCDFCGVLTGRGFGQGARRKNGGLTIHQHGLDLVGDPVCDASQKFDLCDACLDRVNQSLDELRKQEGKA